MMPTPQGDGRPISAKVSAIRQSRVGVSRLGGGATPLSISDGENPEIQARRASEWESGPLVDSLARASCLYAWSVGGGGVFSGGPVSPTGCKKCSGFRKRKWEYSLD